MAPKTRLDRFTDAVEGVLPEGAELVEARFSEGPLLTLLVDRHDGVMDHQFTSGLMRTISPALDELGYGGMVEVSSPGIERPLTRPEHFQRFAGHEARIRTGEPVDGQRNFTGTIQRGGEEGFSLKLAEGGEEVELPYGLVTRATLREELDK